MSFINKIIKEAKSHPYEIVIPLNKVGGVIEHIAVTTAMSDYSIIEKHLLDGQVKLLNVPLRVIKR